MMTNTKLVVGCLLVALFTVSFSCSAPLEHYIEPFEHHISKHDIVDTVHSSELLHSYEYIALETADDFIMGEVDKLKVFDDKLFILSENQVFVYNLKGEFLYKVNKPGRGPEEYLKIDNISLDNNMLYLYDNIQYRVLQFNAATGQYQNTQRLLHSVKEIQLVDNVFFADRSQIPNKYIQGDERLLVGTLEDQEDITPLFTTPDNFHPANNYRLESYNKQVLWIDPMYNKIYRVEPDGVHSFIYYDFGERNVPEDLSSGSDMTELGEEGKVFNLSNTYGHETHIVSNINYGNRMLFMVYDLKKMKNIIYKKIGAYPHESNLVAHAVYKDMFYKVIPPWEVVFMKENMKEKGYVLTEGMDGFNSYKIINSRSEVNNPLIAVFTLK